MHIRMSARRRGANCDVGKNVNFLERKRCVQSAVLAVAKPKLKLEKIVS